MILTMRTWQVAREYYTEFARLSEDEFWPAFERLDGRPLALWVARVGMQERVVLMTCYKSLEHWLATRSWGPLRQSSRPSLIAVKNCTPKPTSSRCCRCRTGSQSIMRRKRNRVGMFSKLGASRRDIWRAFAV